MYYREVRGCKEPSQFLLLTKSDAVWAAQQLDEVSGTLYFHEAHRNFLGYEGADYGVHRYKRTKLGHRGEYLHNINLNDLREMCKDRPIVPQSKSFN